MDKDLPKVTWLLSRTLPQDSLFPVVPTNSCFPQKGCSSLSLMQANSPQLF